MKVSHRKGLATHPDPESCVAVRKAAIEALALALQLSAAAAVLVFLSSVF